MINSVSINPINTTIIYDELFDMLRNHNYNKFIDTVNELTVSNNKYSDSFDINVKDPQHNYFLTYAVIFNNVELIKFLLQKNARLDIIDKYERSILYYPIKYSFYDVINLLLEKNLDNIGISIIDIKDKNKHTALHYAIENQNLKIISILLEYGSDANAFDIRSYNSLHMAIKSRSLEMCKIIMPYISNINSRTNTGETSLHLSCNLQLQDISEFLIKSNINLNIRDYKTETTALHYAVLLGLRDICKLMIEYDVNINSQDIYGNTPLHYAVSENRVEIFIILINSNLSINYNIWNIDNDIPAHIALKQNKDNMTTYIDSILEKSNMSIQDGDGNTCLYYLIKFNLWKKYKDILIKKRLDCFVKNRKKIILIDEINNKQDKKEFIDMIIESYFYRLKNHENLWYYEWENVFSKKYENLTNDEKTKYKITKTNYDILCLKFIKDKIYNLEKKIKNNETINCYDKSFPVKRSVVCIDVKEGEQIDYCTFTGSTLDVLFGLLFLLKKHKNICSTLNKTNIDKKDLCDFYKSLGIIMNSKCESLNFEIIWVHQKLYVMENFYENFEKCMNCNSRFIIIPLGIELKEGGHAGYLIYDSKKKEVERFEPHGSTIPIGLYYNPQLLDELLEQKFKNIDENIKYIRPEEYLPKIGFQMMDVGENWSRRIGDPLGFCALWCIWYTDMRITYSDFDRKKLVNLLIQIIKEKNISFRNMVRNYGQYIVDIRDDILKRSVMDINDWFNDQYTNEQIDNFMDILTNELDKYIQT